MGFLSGLEYGWANNGTAIPENERGWGTVPGAVTGLLGNYMVKQPWDAFTGLAEQWDSAEHGRGYDPQVIQNSMLELGVLSSPVGMFTTRNMGGPVFGAGVAKFGKYGPRQDFQVDLARALADKDFKAMSFGKLSPSQVKKMNELRASLGVDLLDDDRLVIPKKIVQHLYERRVLKDNMTPAEVADSLYSAVHNSRARILPGRIPESQVSATVKGDEANVGLLTRWRGDGYPAVVTGYEGKTKSLPNKVGPR